MTYLSRTDLLFRMDAHGMWLVSSFILLATIASYVILCIRIRDGRWYENAGAQFGIALAVLTLGHVLFAGHQWMRYALLYWGKDPGWFDTWQPIVMSTAVILLGKLACLWMFVPLKWRICVVTTAFIMIATVPWLLWILV